MGFLCLSAKFMKPSQSIYQSSIFKNSIQYRSLLGQCQEHWLRPRIESKQCFHSLPLWSGEGWLTSLSLSFLNYKMDIIMDYGNVNINIDNVRRCSINPIALVLKGWFLDQQHQHPLGKFSGLTPDLLNQKHCKWGPSNFCFTKPPGDSCGCWHWRSTALKHVHLPA